MVGEVTQIVEHGDGPVPKAAEELLPLVYGELRKLAVAKMAQEAPGHTLQPTALVHEAWLRLCQAPGAKWNSRGHFFGAAAEAMRRILIDRARRKKAVRHGGEQNRVDMEELEFASSVPDDELLAVHDALEKLASHDARKAELVKLRYFAGLTTQEAAEVLGISVPTADRWWNYSRAWLYSVIERERNASQEL